jgi:serine/alanine adding enzyme
LGVEQQMHIVNHLDRDCWLNFLEKQSKGNIFHTPELLEVFSCARGHHPELWAAIDDDGQILALHLPVQINLFEGPLRLLTTRAVDLGGVLVENSERGRTALSLLLTTYNRHISRWLLSTAIRNASDQSGIQDILTKCGYKYEDHFNFQLDLRRDRLEIFQSFSKSTRNHIRRIQRCGDVAVEEMTDRAMLPHFYQILQKTYQHARIPLPDLSLFQAAFDILVPKNMARFAIAYVEKTPASAAVTLNYRDVMFGWYNGTDRDFSKHRPNECLVWNTIEWGSDNGYCILDFGGGGGLDDKSGVRDFKAKFSGELTNYGRNICIHAPRRMKIGTKAYQQTRKILRKIEAALPNL